MEAIARAGLAARGLTYLIIALIAAQIALGGAAQSADQHGAIEDVASRPFGWLLLIAMALGFAAYAFWRWWAQRLGALAMGFVYAGLCFSTILVVTGRSTSSTTQQQQSATARLLGLPLGRALVIAIGVGIVIGGSVVIWRALTRTFEKNLASEKMGQRMRRWATGLGIAGNGAGGIVLGLVGVFLIQAAAANNAHASKGLDQTLRTVAHAPFGQALLLVVTVGLAAYGLYSFVEMRFRRV
jgi:MFS family permease